METLNGLPWAAQNSVFQRLAEIAEVSAMLRGESKGRAEERVALARKMKQRGMSVAEIAELTDLTEDELARL